MTIQLLIKAGTPVVLARVVKLLREHGADADASALEQALARADADFGRVITEAEAALKWWGNGELPKPTSDEVG